MRERAVLPWYSSQDRPRKKDQRRTSEFRCGLTPTGPQSRELEVPSSLIPFSPFLPVGEPATPSLQPTTHHHAASDQGLCIDLLVYAPSPPLAFVGLVSSHRGRYVRYLPVHISMSTSRCFEPRDCCWGLSEFYVPRLESINACTDL